MKKALVFAALLIVFLAVDASAAGFGSVWIPFEPDVGWVIVNTTASGALIVVAHVEAGLPNEDFSVSLRVRYEDGNNDIYEDITVLSTNSEGKGTVVLRVPTNLPDGSTTVRRVAVRVRRAPQPLYLAVVWDVTLKPHDLPSGLGVF